MLKYSHSHGKYRKLHLVLLRPYSCNHIMKTIPWLLIRLRPGSCNSSIGGSLWLLIYWGCFKLEDARS